MQNTPNYHIPTFSGDGDAFDEMLVAASFLYLDGNVLPNIGGITKIWDSIEAGVVFPTASIGPIVIPATFKHLLIRRAARTNASGAFILGTRFNGDAGANYAATEGNGANYGPALTYASLGYMTDVGDADPFDTNVGQSLILDYLVTGQYRYALTPAIGGGQSGSLGALYGPWIGRWSNHTDPIASLTFIPSSGSLVAPTHIEVLGLSA